MAEAVVEGGEDESEMEDESAKEGVKERRQRMHRFWANQLLLGEWMVTAPEGLGQEVVMWLRPSITQIFKQWYVTARPEGRRCLVVSSRGKTISRRTNGTFSTFLFTSKKF